MRKGDLFTSLVIPSSISPSYGEAGRGKATSPVLLEVRVAADTDETFEEFCGRLALREKPE
jgi:hypothetical protein